MSTPATSYAGGEVPVRGDTIQYADQTGVNRRVNREARELWIVTSVCGDMVRAKCLDADSWRQAFYTAQMKLVRRRPSK